MNLLLELGEGLRIALEAIRANKLRSILTTLGIIIGVVTVTLMGTAIDGLNRAFMESVAKLGVDTLYISRTGWFVESYEQWMSLRNRRPITLRQVLGLEEEATLVTAVAPIVETMQSVKYRDREAQSVRIIGTTEQAVLTGGTGVARGRYFTAEESDGGRPVCVIGSDVATNLFPHTPPMGNQIKIGFQPFEIVGVMEKQGSFLGAFSLDNQITIPVRQFISHFWHDPDFQIQVKVANVAWLDEAKEELRGAMRKVRRLEPGEPDDFDINQQEQLAERLAVVSRTIAAVGLFITGLSLFVGGIGIMNIMFVSVTERTQEIGLRKALGAKRRTILIQFLIEAAAICILGGLLALAIAWPLTLALAQFMPARLSLPLVGLALLVSLLTGLISGFLPAWRAARMNPVDALRNE
ncbi:MAG: ABC transporter permease [Verrucomicrobiales bacterium]|nr:ABC transporter permease [Verrucomicrobiales bacterium]MCP5526537.1 ABC transporter permease [Verrucomicrobiales bacterium]